MLKTRIAVLVSGGGTNLQALIDAQKCGIISHGEIVLVISNNENAYALERAKQNEIKTEIITKQEYNTLEQFEGKIIEKLEEKNIDLIVFAGFMSILSKDFTDRYPKRIINVHPSLIPSFCGEGFYGLKVHEAALEYGVKVTGATVHFVNEIPDGGEIILQKAVEVKEGDTPEVLQRRVMEEAEWKILPQAVEQISKRLMEE
jgi:phosphoribosylglycinamide formyltransferase-1